MLYEVYMFICVKILDHEFVRSSNTVNLPSHYLYIIWRHSMGGDRVLHSDHSRGKCIVLASKSFPDSFLMQFLAVSGQEDVRRVTNQVSALLSDLTRTSRSIERTVSW